ncbi:MULTISPECIES: hypothetical protein [Cysteiniphilum]|uniref:Uncharacterized protein n=1 Tax=Cysteiniphilum litorale TaxID=2056700 RepID=A0A8J2Z3L3_9GAMM|nr:MULTISPECIES: hypothetical protein [Cysteiniphilum]GGF93362.1 hypothetical protein GCM10010995_08110 [Cysteiniphilum litorale]
MLKKIYCVFVGSTLPLLGFSSGYNPQLNVSLKNNCPYPLKITVAQLNDDYNVIAGKEVTTTVLSGQTIKNVATYGTPNIEVSDNKGGYMIVNLSDHYSAWTGWWGHVGKIKGNDYADLVRGDWSEDNDGDIANAQATACSRTSVLPIGLGNISVKENGQDIFYRDLDINNGVYQVFFSASPTMCTISKGNINCDNTNVGYTKVGDSVIFICQHKNQGSPVCSWLSNKSSDMKSISIY